MIHSDVGIIMSYWTPDRDEHKNTSHALYATGKLCSTRCGSTQSPPTTYIVHRQGVVGSPLSLNPKSPGLSRCVIVAGHTRKHNCPRCPSTIRTLDHALYEGHRPPFRLHAASSHLLRAAPVSVCTSPDLVCFFSVCRARLLPTPRKDQLSLYSSSLPESYSIE